MPKLTQEILNKVKVKVYKKTPDDRTSLCGEPVQSDENGREYFIIPSHQAEYISLVFRHYEVGEEFIPENPEDLKKKDK